MKRKGWITGALVVAGIAVGGPVQAQGIGFRLGAGPTIPVGHLADETSNGFNVLAGASLSVPLVPVGVRADLMFNRLPEVHEGHFQSFSGSVNGVFRLPMVGITPYVIAGVGLYNSRFTDAHEDNGDTDRADATTNVGANVGAGVQITIFGFGAFAEGRFHHLFHEGEPTQLAPLTIGVVF